MDVTKINNLNILYSPGLKTDDNTNSLTSEDKIIGNNPKKEVDNPKISDPLSLVIENKKKVDEQLNILMDQKEVQNFLYMMIGFDIKLESDNKETGENFSSVA